MAVPNRWKPTPVKPVDPPSAELAQTKLSDGADATRILVPHESSEENILRKIDLNTALQYGTAQGYPPLYGFIRQFTQTNMHPNVPYKGGPEVILTVGSTDGFAKSIEAFSNIWDEDKDWIRDREGILCEEFAYMNAIQAAKPRGLAVTPVKIDNEGMLAEGKGGLADVLKNWDKYKGKRPHLMYTVTMGQNPTSGLLSLTRRKQIYAICQKYDILIIEDDPYWFLQYPSANTLSVQHRGHPVSTNQPITPTNYNTLNSGKSSGYAFLDSLVPSYLSVDTDGRVIRLDTFSKSIAPGCRLGWITAQPAFIDYIQRITETSTQQPSGFVQSLVAELIVGPSSSATDPGRGGSKDGSGWDTSGWVRWLSGLRGNYERRMQVMASILEDGKHLVHHKRTPSYPTDEADYELICKTQLFDFAYPMAGMFLWLRVHFESHPLFQICGGPKLAQALWVFMTTAPYRVLLAPGSLFSPTQEILDEKGWRYFRLCFAAVDDDVVKSSSEGFVRCVADFWAIEREKEIDDILKEGEEDESVRRVVEENQVSFPNTSFGVCVCEC